MINFIFLLSLLHGRYTFPAYPLPHVDIPNLGSFGSRSTGASFRVQDDSFHRIDDIPEQLFTDIVTNSSFRHHGIVFLIPEHPTNLTRQRLSFIQDAFLTKTTSIPILFALENEELLNTVKGRDNSDTLFSQRLFLKTKSKRATGQGKIKSLFGWMLGADPGHPTVKPTDIPTILVGANYDTFGLMGLGLEGMSGKVGATGVAGVLETMRILRQVYANKAARPNVNVVFLLYGGGSADGYLGLRDFWAKAEKEAKTGQYSSRDGSILLGSLPTHFVFFDGFGGPNGQELRVLESVNVTKKYNPEEENSEGEIVEKKEGLLTRLTRVLAKQCGMTTIEEQYFDEEEAKEEEAAEKKEEKPEKNEDDDDESDEEDEEEEEEETKKPTKSSKQPQVQRRMPIIPQEMIAPKFKINAITLTASNTNLTFNMTNRTSTAPAAQAIPNFPLHIPTFNGTDLITPASLLSQTQFAVEVVISAIGLLNTRAKPITFKSSSGASITVDNTTLVEDLNDADFALAVTAILGDQCISLTPNGTPKSSQYGVLEDNMNSWIDFLCPNGLSINSYDDAMNRTRITQFIADTTPTLSAFSSTVPSDTSPVLFGLHTAFSQFLSIVPNTLASVPRWISSSRPNYVPVVRTPYVYSAELYHSYPMHHILAVLLVIILIQFVMVFALQMTNVGLFSTHPMFRWAAKRMPWMNIQSEALEAAEKEKKKKDEKRKKLEKEKEGKAD
ncbi:hypothetical protein BLNAU_10429 [Blattamonas nauphoetae]|uniref:Peptidase M28 domain-containing protein n=1 Tax=Blattamonas nauphoetae TaxID=2049346 RepID=A0ABQ9XQA0_9EUKA|nr:hypothetical protein BLNAU_10429 [Blattamonas nauphoetae]